METESPVQKVSSHPKVSLMVDAAIESLNERKGSSLHAINKYISSFYNVDTKKLSVYIKKYLKSAVERGDMIQPTGKGASGSFKIAKNKVAAEAKKAEVKPNAPKKFKNQTKTNQTEAKPAKLHKMQFSTPKRILKPKKAAMKSPKESPVQALDLIELDEKLDATFTKPTKKTTKKTRVSLPTNPRKSKLSLPLKMKKPKKLAKKGKGLQGSVSPKPKQAASKIVKEKVAAKSAKAKKSPKQMKPTVSKKTVSKKISNDEQK